ELTEEVENARGRRHDSERRRAQADAAVGLAERQLEAAGRAAADLAEREGRLAVERDEVVRLLAGAAHDVATAEARLAAIVADAAGERERLRQAESTVSAARERLRIAQERARQDEREDVEARLALESLREQLLVELAGLGTVSLRHLGVTSSIAGPDDALRESGTDGGDAGDRDREPAPEDIDPDDLERALAT